MHTFPMGIIPKVNILKSSNSLPVILKSCTLATSSRRFSLPKDINFRGSKVEVWFTVYLYCITGPCLYVYLFYCLQQIFFKSTLLLGLRIRWLHLLLGKIPLQKKKKKRKIKLCPRYDSKLHSMSNSSDRGSMQYTFNPIIPTSTLTWRGSSC